MWRSMLFYADIAHSTSPIIKTYPINGAYEDTKGWGLVSMRLDNCLRPRGSVSKRFGAYTHIDAGMGNNHGLRA